MEFIFNVIVNYGVALVKGASNSYLETKPKIGVARLAHISMPGRLHSIQISRFGII